MFKSVTIRNFRGFSDLTVDGLTRVNLILGDNGAGKTSLLEALFVLAGRANPDLALRMNRWRGLPVPIGGARPAFSSYFHEFNTEVAVSIMGERDEGRRSERLTMTLDEVDRQDVPLLPSSDEEGSPSRTMDAPTPASDDALEVRWEGEDEEPVMRRARFYRITRDSGIEFLMRVEPPLAHRGPRAVFVLSGGHVNPAEERERFTKVVQTGRKEDMIESLRILDERVQDLELLSLEAETILHADIGGGRQFPLGLLGDGMVHATSVYLGAAWAQDGLLLVDEIDTGLHYTALADGFWQSVHRAALDFDVQVFATTHSHECMVAAYEAFEGQNAEDLSVHRLERVNGELQCKSFGHEVLGEAMRAGFEVR